MINELIKLANHLDKRGLKKEADYLDALIKKHAEEWIPTPAGRWPANTFGEFKAGTPPHPGVDRRHTATWLEDRENDRITMNYCVRKGDTLSSITEAWSAGKATWMENAELNDLKEPYTIWPCQRLLIWTPFEAQDMTGPSGPSHCPPECEED